MKTLLLLFLALTCNAQKIESLVEAGNVYGLTIGPDGALYWCDIDGHAVRRMNLKTKAVTTVVGTGVKGNSGDDGPATSAEIDQPYEVRFDAKGNLYFADMTNHVIRRVDQKTGKIRTIAGTGKAGFNGDGGYATKASFRQPHSIVFDLEGRLLVCDIGNDRVRRIDLKSGLIETYLGNGEKKDPVEGAKTFDTPLLAPRAIEVSKDGKLYIIKRQGNALYEVDPKKATYHLLAATGMNGPKGISSGPKRGLLIADTENHAIQRFDLKTGALKRVAGSGVKGDGPDGDPLECKMNRPHGVFVDRKGTIYVGDSEAHRIRRLQIVIR